MADLLRLEQQLCFALHAASRAMTRVYQPLKDRLDLTYPQYVALLVLWERDGVRVSDLGERLFLDSATLTPLLKRLEARGLVVRRRSTVDERVVEVFLTPEGRALKKKVAAIVRDIYCASDLEEAEIAELRGALQDLTRRLHVLSGSEHAPRDDGDAR